MLVAGEAGVGKTALVRRVLRDASRAPRACSGARVTRSSLRDLSARSSTSRQATGGELHELVRARGDPISDRSRLARGAPDRSPTVLVLEDLHWADEATLDVFAARAGGSETCALLVATYRDDELDRKPSAAGRARRARRGPAIQRIPLTAVARGCRTLAERTRRRSGRPLPRDVRQPVLRAEVLAGDAEGIPETVRDAVLARLAGLSSGARAFSRPFRSLLPEPSCGCSSASAGRLDGELDECLGDGMLGPVAHEIVLPPRARPTHVEESLTPRRRLALHRKALAALEAHRRARRTSRGLPTMPTQRRPVRPCFASPQKRLRASSARRLSRGRRALRPRAPLRRRSPAARACRAARRSLGRVLPRRRPGRGDRRAPQGDRSVARQGIDVEGGRGARRELTDYLLCRGLVHGGQEDGREASGSSPASRQRARPRACLVTCRIPDLRRRLDASVEARS